MQLTGFKNRLVKDVFHYVKPKRKKESRSIFNIQVKEEEAVYQDENILKEVLCLS